MIAKSIASRFASARFCKVSTAIGAAALVVMLGAVSTPALAQHSGHAHGDGWGGGWGGGWHGGYGWHGGFYGGFGFYDPFWWGWGYPYYYPYDYPAYAYPYAYPYAAPAAPAPAAPPQYAPAPPQNVWYYCRSSKAYYPYVSSCREAWQQVPTTPPH